MCVLLVAETCMLMVFKQVMFDVGLHVTRAHYLMASPSYPHAFYKLFGDVGRSSFVCCLFLLFELL